MFVKLVIYDTNNASIIYLLQMLPMKCNCYRIIAFTLKFLPWKANIGEISAMKGQNMLY